MFGRIHPSLKYASKATVFMLSWLPVVVVVNTQVVYIGKIEGSSMRPTLNPSSLTQDWVILWKLGAKSPRNIHLDDVILFRSPENPEKVLCKRVKGIQGDTIKTRYPYPRELTTVPRAHLWVEGDNVHSIDSNKFGPISCGLVLGKATNIIWPPQRFGAIPIGGRDARVHSGMG